MITKRANLKFRAHIKFWEMLFWNLFIINDLSLINLFTHEKRIIFIVFRYFNVHYIISREVKVQLRIRGWDSMGTNNRIALCQYPQYTESPIQFTMLIIWNIWEW